MLRSQDHRIGSPSDRSIRLYMKSSFVIAFVGDLVVPLVQGGCKCFGVDKHSLNTTQPVSSECGFEGAPFISGGVELQFVARQVMHVCPRWLASHAFLGREL